MDAYKEAKNRQMQLMLLPARERLKKYSIEEILRKSGIRYDEKAEAFVFSSMGQDIQIHYPDFEVDRELDMWHHLTILQYMDTADGTPLSGKWIGLSQMRGGLSRGKGFDKDISTMIERSFKDADIETVKRAAEQLGGVVGGSRADLSVIIPYAPCFPVLFHYWEGDDEFPPSGKCLVDALAEHYLTIEAAGGACAAVVQELIKKL